MNPAIRARRIFGTCALVVGLTAIVASSARAEAGAKWTVGTKDAKELPAEIQIKELVGGKATVKTAIGGVNVKFNATGMELIGAKLEGEGKVTSGAKVKFTGVTTEFNGKVSLPCTPLGELGVDSTLGLGTGKAKGELILHSGISILKLLPVTGEILFTKIFGEECALPEEVPVITKKGLTLTDPLGMGNLLAEHEFTELAALSELWAINEFPEHKVTIEGKAKIVLVGPGHAGLKWSGAAG